MLLDGKVAIVTGASRGIGKSIAMSLANEGADICINCAGRLDAAEDVASEIRKMGRKAMVIKANVSEINEVKDMVKSVINEFGHIDILVNNAGITKDNLIMRMPEEDWDTVMEVNLKGAFNCTKAVTRTMLKARYGRIINISSVVGLSGNAGQSNYAATKAGLIGFTKAMAKELGSRNITVNAVAPGFIETEMTETLSSELKQKMKEQVALGYLGKPENVASTVVFLASNKATYITGQVISVDGGLVL